MLVKIIIAVLVVVHTALVVLWFASGILFYIDRIHGPGLNFAFPLGKDGLGYCTPSTDRLEDLIVNESLRTQDEAANIEFIHGMSIVEAVLSEETTKDLRSYLLKANHEVDSSYVHFPENRYHIMPDHNAPQVKRALKEIAEHCMVRPMLEQLLGPGPSLVAFSVITNMYGAQDQNWHGDTVTSNAAYPDHFVPEYTLAIALQDTTKEMGATGLCPGTHRCEFPAYNDDELRQHYYENQNDLYWEYEDFDAWIQYNLPCELAATTKAGDALLYNADVFHRGRAHSDPNGPERVQAFFTFAGSRQGPDDKRSLPLGTVHTLRWYSWGHTLDDFATMEEYPWRPWHSFGLFLRNRDDGVRPWTLLDDISLIYRNNEERAHAISEDFNADYVRNVVDEMLKFTGVATFVYVAMAPFLVFLILMLFVHNEKGVARF
mmetsp:Transcript_20035/g.28382  ORF Transcript_20035/g.28382 Transcript_20035/m.28382 type:complete len:432 (-) Transcript_20035:40-1335(-)